MNAKTDIASRGPLQHESHGYEVGCQIWLLGVIWELESGKDIVNVWFPALQWNSHVYLVLYRRLGSSVQTNNLYSHSGCTQVSVACIAMAEACASCSGILCNSVRTSSRHLKVTLCDGYEEILSVCGPCLRTCWIDQCKLEDLDVCGKTRLYQDFWYIAKDELWRILQKRLVSFNDSRCVQQLNFV